MLINVKVGGASHNLKLLSHHSKKRSTTPSFLNGVCGGGNRGVLLACPKRAFVEAYAQQRVDHQLPIKYPTEMYVRVVH
jgi:hypothetical protein